MVSLAALWLPIVLSAVIVFVASSIMHMLLPYHRSDYRKLPDEDKVLAALRAAGVQRGLYVFPYCTHKDMKSPALIEKQKQGPVGFMTIVPSGPPAMPKFLIQWFAFLLVVGIFVAYLAAHTVPPGAKYLVVYRVVGTAAFLAYGSGKPEQRHLERSALDGDHQGGRRWTYLRVTDWRHLRLAVAAVEPPRERVISAGTLALLAGGSPPTRQVLLIESLSDQSLDHCLAADIQLFGGPVQFLQHARGQININPLNWTHHASRIGEEPRHIPPLVRKAGDAFCRYWSPNLSSVLHKVGAPAWWPSIGSQDGKTPLRDPLALRRLRYTIALPPIRSRGIARARLSVGQGSMDAQILPAPLRIRCLFLDLFLTSHSSAHRNETA